MKTFVNLCGCCLESNVPLSERFNEPQFPEIHGLKFVEIVQRLISNISFERGHIYKFCEQCSALVQGAHLLKKLMLRNQEKYEKYLKLFNPESRRLNFLELSINPNGKNVSLQKRKRQSINEKSNHDTSVHKTPKNKDSPMQSSAESDSDRLVCKYCNKDIKRSYIKKHLKKIHPRRDPNVKLELFRPEKQTSVENKIANNQNKYDTSLDEVIRIQCKYCKHFYSKAFIEKHEKMVHFNLIEPLHDIIYEIESSDEEGVNVADLTKDESDDDIVADNANGVSQVFNDSSTSSANLGGTPTEKTDGKSKCRICKRYFSRKYVRQHEKAVHREELTQLCQLNGDVNFECVYCHKFYMTERNYRAHMFKHTRRSGFKCTICDEAFPFEINLNDHIIAIHQGGNSDGQAFGDSLWGINFDNYNQGQSSLSKNPLKPMTAPTTFARPTLTNSSVFYFY